MLRIVLNFAFCVLCICESFSQGFKYKHFDVDDGLPSSQVLSGFQDKEGYVWFATDNGLSRFDGYTFQNFSTKDGMIENTVLTGHIAGDSSILFTTLSSGFFWYKDGHFTKIKSKEYDQLLNSKNWRIRTFAVDKHKTIWFSSTEGRVYYSLDLSGKLTKYICEEDKSERGSIGTFLILVDDNTLLPVAKNKAIKAVDGSFENERVISNKKSTYLQGVFVKSAKKINDSFILLPENGNRPTNEVFYYSNERGVYSQRIRINGVKSYITSVVVDNTGNRWMGYEKGVLIYQGNDIEQEPIHILTGEYITEIFQDFERNIWVTTKDNGVFLISGKDIKNYLIDEKVIALDTYDGVLWGTTVKGKVFKFDSLDVFTEVFNRKSKNLVNASNISKNGVFLYDGIYSFSGKKIKSFNKDGINAKKVICIQDSLYIIGTHIGISYASLNDGTYKEIKGPRLRVNGLFYEKSMGRVLLGTVKGLFAYDLKNKTYSDLRVGKSLLSERIMDVKKLAKSYLLATKGMGLVIYDTDTLFSVTMENGLKSNLISCITIENDSTIWVGSNKGVSKISFNPYSKEIKKILNYTSVDGLAANEVTDIFFFNKKVWVSTSKGLSIIPPGQDDSYTITPLIKIAGIYINNKPVSYTTSDFLLLHNENNIFINYLAVSYKEPGKVKYRYRLRGYNNDWTQTQSLNANFTNIPAGDYSFEVQAMNKNDIWSASKQINFSIAQHFSKTLWFIVLVIIVMVSIPTSIVFFIYRSRRQQERQKRKALESQLFALRNQISPHFIFNALNSIQAYNVKARDREAISYLAKFSELMRQILENAKRSFISLHDEISCITNYLNLESLRTNNRFTYTIEVDKELGVLHTLLPPMLIQPHLENAIWKGFTKEIKSPHISIVFQKQKNMLVIKICDNGVGINKGQATKAKLDTVKGYQSTGLKNINDRIQNIKQLYDIDIFIDIKDLSEEKEGASGTEVQYSITLLTEEPVYLD